MEEEQLPIVPTAEPRPTTANSVKFDDDTVIQPTDSMEIFSFMMVEEFLMKKRMTGALAAFREEWKRPNEEQTMFSWYDICVKLHLLEHLQDSKNNPRETVLENLGTMLTQEASIRSRIPAQSIVEGLAVFPKSNPTIGSRAYLEMEDSKVRDTMRRTAITEFQESRQNLSEVSLTTQSTRVIARRYDGGASGVNSRVDSQGGSSKKKGYSDYRSGKPGKTSAENWIPEVTRIKSLGRDLAVAQDNLDDIVKRETQADRELRQFKTTDFEKALVQESLGSKKKIECGCCMLQFTYVNLPLRVSNKAVVDNRRKWSNNAKGWWSTRDEKLATMPRCYNDVWVCTFCAQFFMDQDNYRPSFQKLEMEQKKAIYIEKKLKEKEYWDPVKKLDADRAELERLEDEEMARKLEENDDVSVAGSIGTEASTR